MKFYKEMNCRKKMCNMESASVLTYSEHHNVGETKDGYRTDWLSHLLMGNSTVIMLIYQPEHEKKTYILPNYTYFAFSTDTFWPLY